MRTINKLKTTGKEIINEWVKGSAYLYGRRIRIQAYRGTIKYMIPPWSKVTEKGVFRKDTSDPRYKRFLRDLIRYYGKGDIKKPKWLDYV